MASFFSVSAMKRVFKSRTDKRISKDSAEELRAELKEYAEEVSEEAVDIAEEKDRETVRKEDIREALD